jgi:hypothetical protein
MEPGMSGEDRLRAVILMVLMAGLGMKAWWWPMPAPVIPSRVPAACAQPWMADCLPGVGPKSRDRMAEAIRAGRWDDLPARARPMAEQVFDDGQSVRR